MTSGGGLGMLGVATVGGRQVNVQGTVIAESFEAVTFLFHFGELSVCPNTSICSSWLWCVSRCGQGVAQFCWCGGEGRLPSLTRGCGLLTLAFPAASVTFQGVGLELLEHVGVIQ